MSLSGIPSTETAQIMTSQGSESYFVLFVYTGFVYSV